MAQRSVGENPSDPSVDIQANGNIHIEAYDNAVMAGAINNNQGTAELKMTAGGTIDISSQSGAAVHSFDKSGRYESDGPTFIDIEGTKGVSLKGTYGVFTTRNLAGDSNLNITSQEGDVYIEGSQYGLVVQSSGNNAYSDKTNINGTITGNNVTIANTNSDNYAVSINNSEVTLATNRDGGTIALQSQSGKAANIINKNPNSSKGSLTIGDGEHETNFVSNGSLSIGKNATVTVADKTTTYVDVNALKDKPFIQNDGGGTFQADAGAKLIVDNATAGYQLFSDATKVTNWTAANTSFDNAFLTLNDNGTVTTVSAEEAAKSLGAFAAHSIALAATTANDTAITPLLKEGADAYNSAVNIGELGGAAHSTYTVSNLFTDAIAAHNAAQDKDIWAQYLHSKESVDGFGLAGTSANYDGQYNGVIVGGDIIRSQNKALGLAFSYTDGDISGSNGTAYTKNDAEYYGVALYGRLENPGYTLLGDISYLGGSHDISQYVAGQHVTAKPDTEAWSVGVKALRDYEVGSGTVTPYIGVRYLRLTTDQYTSSLGIHYDSETQNLFLLPVGVDYSADIDHGSWKLRPYIGAGYIWTMGDRNGDQTISYGNAADTIAFDTADSGSFLAKAGITADWNTFSFGIGYAYQKSDNVKNNVWMANASFKF
ncbi:autotransporter outer membrane beta-barrel domain-containing protein [Megasphaera stantonii]|uniref:autotransporter family protein n=1 Tax=Megasphaera stantonii TaxID=2144175 RepID=UPI00195EC982|nr:autotransporter outer membrane beta-barrel domain-containing protein [Megasphaera stantonii]MBM6731312.1 autotransporter domain-containing protein [Megasphaera stantonii]